MEDSKDLKDFQNWIKKTQDDANDWVNYLVYESKKVGKTYAGAIRCLQRNKPEFPRSYKATPTENVSNVVQSIYEEAIFKVRDEALSKEIDDND
ncbi:hypothetical protein [Lactobacillus helveticus]|uniref:hypothetical protein n=1 Tax=Lactobacillus helveticus TaxID=1587 RepID=UPI00062A615F|nr:hypothetical protein [Lactobacillus helveticus]AKG67085.1 hypothetical protein TU99_07580 [Lactobacillus helveticus]